MTPDNVFAKILKQRPILKMTLGMVLHHDPERVIAQPNLLDDIIGGGPCFDQDSMTWCIDRLMMRTVHRAKPMQGREVVS